MRYDKLKEAYEMGKKRALKSSYYRLMIWPLVQKNLRAALSKAYIAEKLSKS